MPRDPEKAILRRQRYQEKCRSEKYGPAAASMDMRGRTGTQLRGPAHPRWSDARMIGSNGYAKVRVGRDHPLSDPNGYAYEHLLVWASAGRTLPTDAEILHHRNEIKTDNRLDNLEKKSRVEHGVGHQPTALPDAEVIALREAYAAGDHTGILASRYGIPQQTVWKLVRGKTRRSAGGPIQEAPLRKKAAGRLLDGEEHNAMPDAPRAGSEGTR